MTSLTYQTYYYPRAYNSTMLDGKVPKSAKECYLKTEYNEQIKNPDQIRSMIHPFIMKDAELVSRLSSGSYKVACTIVKKIQGVESGTETVILY